METVLTRNEWKLRWEASTRGAKVECRSGRAGAWGRKEWGKSVGSAGSTCPLALCENRRAARGRESAFIGHLPWLGDRPEPFWSTLPCAGFCFQWDPTHTFARGADGQQLTKLSTVLFFHMLLLWSFLLGCFGSVLSVSFSSVCLKLFTLTLYPLSSWT